MGRRVGKGHAPPTLTEEDSVFEGEGRGALLAAEAAHGAGYQPPPLPQSHKLARGAD